MKDFTIIGLFDFYATEVTVVPITPRAKELFKFWMGAGAVSCTVRRSMVSKFTDDMDKAGLDYSDGAAAA